MDLIQVGVGGQDHRLRAHLLDPAARVAHTDSGRDGFRRSIEHTLIPVAQHNDRAGDQHCIAQPFNARREMID